MKDRIMELMKMEGMTQQEFATALDISPASLSNIFNGKTNPTNNHVNAIHKRFPNINISWLMFGEGNMYIEGSDIPGCKTNVQEMDKSISASNNADYLQQSSGGTSAVSHLDIGSAIPKETVKFIDKPERKIVEIRIFFDDGTYETFSR